jgi:hypothetical protein
MFFIAQLTHSPELCFARPEHKEKYDELFEFLNNMEKYEKEAEVKLHGFYLNANEHTFYFIIEADNYLKLSKFLGVGPILTHHKGRLLKNRCKEKKALVCSEVGSLRNTNKKLR